VGEEIARKGGLVGRNLLAYDKAIFLESGRCPCEEKGDRGQSYKKGKLGKGGLSSDICVKKKLNASPLSLLREACISRGAEGIDREVDRRPV